MQRGFHIGRLFGIDIRIDLSWLLIFFLITWNLGAGFTQANPDWGTSLTWLVAVTASLLFFASVLAHELAHSLVARAQDIPVRSITLFLFGGVSNIQREPPSPRVEFLITIVGPITSFLLGVILLLLAGTTVGQQVQSLSDPAAIFEQLTPLSTLLIWLGSINIVLGIFNMIPGFPLDGGRVLRSILWGATNDLQKATRWSSWVGQGMAGLLVVAGVAMIFGVQVPFFGTGFFSGLWLIFIGWFLNSAAVQSYRRVLVQDLLSDVPVSKIMRNNPPTVPTNTSVQDLVDNHVMQTDDHAFPVMDGEKILGFVTLNDIRATPRDQWNTTLVNSIMTPENKLATVQPDDEASDAMTRLMQHDVRQLPVVASDGKLVGVIRRADIMKWLKLQATD